MAPRIVVIDNYDSFTYNLVQGLGELGAELVVRRNDVVDVDGIAALGPDAIVLSPGPGRPEHAGVTAHVVEAFAGAVPIFGVCLGHQAICQAYGGQIVAAPEIVHGKPSEVRHVGTGIYEGLADPFTAGRYHSLVVDPASLPDELEVTAWSGSIVMGVRHRVHAVEGVQFHPESVLTFGDGGGARVLAHLVASLSSSSSTRT
ncbi:MAG TPA: aminodeoxychorismate/anthranilate synthase component II [Acidimicrobiales bacterium]